MLGWLYIAAMAAGGAWTMRYVLLARKPSRRQHIEAVRLARGVRAWAEESDLLVSVEFEFDRDRPSKIPWRCYLTVDGRSWTGRGHSPLSALGDIQADMLTFDQPMHTIPPTLLLRQSEA